VLSATSDELKEQRTFLLDGSMSKTPVTQKFQNLSKEQQARNLFWAHVLCSNEFVKLDVDAS